MKISIDDLQAYLADRYGGWATEQSMFMKLVEEIGEENFCHNIDNALERAKEIVAVYNEEQKFITKRVSDDGAEKKAKKAAKGGFLHSALLHLRDAGGHADHDARAHEAALVVHLGDEVAEHGFRHFEVGDNAVLHGTDSTDVARGATQHALGFGTHGKHLIIAAAVFFHRHHGRLAQDNALPLDIHAGVCGTKVDSKVIGENA